MIRNMDRLADVGSLQTRFSFVIIRGLVLSGLLTMSAGVAASHADGGAEIPSSEYAHPQRLVDVAGGRRLNLFCTGSGSPTVVYEAGGGENSVSFRRVQKQLSATTRVCSYDRAGLGFSDAAVRASNAANIVADLHRLVEKADLGKPVILLGHSSGGLYAALYAATYRNDVAGMVLIDPSFVGQDRAITQDWTTRQKIAWHAEDQEDIEQARKCLALAIKGVLTEPARLNSPCLDNPPDPDAALHHVMNAQLARPRTQAAMLSEMLNVASHSSSKDGLSAAEKTLRHSHFRFGSKPLIVLTAADQFPDLTGSQRIQALRGWMQGHDALAARSRIGRNIVVQNSSHFIMLDQPAVVVRYTRQIIDAVRASAPTITAPGNKS